MIQGAAERTTSTAVARDLTAACVEESAKPLCRVCRGLVSALQQEPDVRAHSHVAEPVL